MKAVFFDFDGTLTKKSNVWKSLWKGLGFSIDPDSYYAALYRSFIAGKITHQEWCDKTCQIFRLAGTNYNFVAEIAHNIQLVDGAEQTFRALKEAGYSLHIVSGNIINVIRSVLGDKARYFDSINANQMIFDRNGLLTHIKGTNYDFEGKAQFIDEFKRWTNSRADELYFIGNGDNDEYAHKSGCHTICINPDDKTESTNSTKWHKVIPHLESLTEILPFLNIKDDEKDEND